MAMLRVADNTARAWSGHFVAYGEAGLRDATSLPQARSGTSLLASLPDDRGRRAAAGPGHPGAPGRRRGHPRRPLIPPYVRFRMRRFMKYAGGAAPYRAATPA